MVINRAAFLPPRNRRHSIGIPTSERPTPFTCTGSNRDWNLLHRSGSISFSYFRVPLERSFPSFSRYASLARTSFLASVRIEYPTLCTRSYESIVRGSGGNTFVYKHEGERYRRFQVIRRLPWRR